MTVLLLIVCWVEIYPYELSNSVVCEIYDAEVEVIARIIHTDFV
ncbi:MAG: hypothetical protein ACUVQP_10335 [Bacteroidales bacterium]